MKRVFPLLLSAFAMLMLAGCPGGEEGDGETAEGTTTTADGGNPSAGGGEFPSGVDSGRAEDGSDEEK